MTDTLPIDEPVTAPVENPAEKPAAAPPPADDDLLSIEVELPSGETKALRFRNLTGVPIGIVRRTRGNNTEQMWVVFEWAFAPEDLAVFDEMPSAKVLVILAQMQEASKIELGE